MKEKLSARLRKMYNRNKGPLGFLFFILLSILLIAFYIFSEYFVQGIIAMMKKFYKDGKKYVNRGAKFLFSFAKFIITFGKKGFT